MRLESCLGAAESKFQLADGAANGGSLHSIR